jgi:hypothetical protein
VRDQGILFPSIIVHLLALFPRKVIQLTLYPRFATHEIKMIIPFLVISQGKRKYLILIIVSRS